MKTNKRNYLLIWILAVALLLNVLAFVPVVAEGGSDVTGLLDITERTVTQEGSSNPEDGIDINKPFKIKIKFDIPVLGDDLATGEYVKLGDTARFVIAEDSAIFDLTTETNNPFVLTTNKSPSSTIGVGEIFIDAEDHLVATINFGPENEEDHIFQEDRVDEWSEIWAEFEVGLEFTGDTSDFDESGTIYEILGKG